MPVAVVTDDDIMRLTDLVLPTIWERTGPPTPSGCCEYRGTRTGRGYGTGSTKGYGKWSAHRIVWMAVNERPIPDGYVVMHSCDNPPCVNPRHLSIGTQSQNAVDKYEKGRGNPPRGDRHPAAKLTNTQVMEIRERFRTDIPYSVRSTTRLRTNAKELADEYGVTPYHIKAIMRGKERRNG